MTHDPAETDPAALSSSEDLDEDRMQVDPLEEGIEPPERWSEAGHFGTTRAEQQEGTSVEERVAEERPDFGADEPGSTEPTVAATPATELDETIDDLTGEAQPITPADRSPADPASPVSRHSDDADEAGGSMAATIRTPEDPSE